MDTRDVYVYGDIFNEQSEFAEQWGFISLKGIRDQLDGLKEDDEVVVHIHSNGGSVDEGFAIHDFLTNLKNKVTTIVEGSAYSIAVVVALAGEVRKTTENSQWMIHLPSGGVFGDSDDIEKYAEFINTQRDRIASFISKKTGQSKENVLDMMKEDTYFDPDEAENFGLVSKDGVIKGAKALAYFDTKKQKQMSNTKENKKEISENISEEVKKNSGILNKIYDAIKSGKTEETVALKLTTADGVILDITTDKNNDKSKVEPGNKVTVDGKLAEDKEYLLPDESKIIVENGVVKEFVKSDNYDEITNKFNERINGIETRNTELMGELAEARKENKEISKKLDTLLENIASVGSPEDRDFNNKNNQELDNLSPAARAIAMKKADEEESKK